MADSRSNALRKRLQAKLVEKDKKQENLYNQLIDIVKPTHEMNFANLKDKAALLLIKDISERILETIRAYKINNEIQENSLIAFTLDNIRAFLDPILALCRTKSFDSGEIKHDIQYATVQIFDKLSKHFCVFDPTTNSTIDFATAYAHTEYICTLHINTAFSCLTRNENIENAKLYLKQYRKLDLIKINTEPSPQIRESMHHAVMVNYYSGMALYSLHNDDLANVKNYIQKADAALTVARMGAYGFSGTLDMVYQEIIKKHTSNKDYLEVRKCQYLRLALSEEAIYHYQKVIKDRDSGKSMQAVSYMQKIEKILAVELKNKEDIQGEIARLELFIQTIELESELEQLELKQKAKLIENDRIEAKTFEQKGVCNDPNNNAIVTSKKEKISKKEKKALKTLELKKARDLKSEVSTKPTKTIKFNQNYTYSTDAKLRNSFKLYGPKHQYVAITPELVEEIDKLDASISDTAKKWIYNLCDVGKVLGDGRGMHGRGMRGFLLNVPSVGLVKVKDASKGWRVWGEKLKVVVDNKGNEHTLWGLKAFTQKH